MIAGQEYWCITTGTPLNGTITLMTLGDYRFSVAKVFAPSPFVCKRTAAVIVIMLLFAGEKSSPRYQPAR